MKKLLGLCLVCTLFLPMTSTSSMARDKNFKWISDKTGSNRVRVVRGECYGSKRLFFVQTGPGQSWWLGNYGGEYDAKRLANKSGGAKPERMAKIYCSRVR